VSAASVALALAAAALIAPQSAAAAVAPPAPQGIYLDRPWVEVGGTVWSTFVGSTTECGDGYNGFTFDWSFRYDGGEVPLESAGFGEGPWIYRAFAFVDSEFDPLPLGQSAPVEGDVVLTCTPTGGGASSEVTMPLTVRSSAPTSLYNSPTGWTFHTPGDLTDGAVVTVNALGFLPGESVSVAVASFEDYGVSGDWSTSSSAPVVVTADGAGAVTADVTLPVGWNEDNDLTPVVAGSMSRYLLAPGDVEPFTDDTVGIDGTNSAFPGGAVDIDASGYYPMETVTFALHSDAAPIVLGTMTADSNGDVSGILWVPSSVPVGDYRLWGGASEIDFALFNAPFEITAVPATDRLSGPDRFQTAVAISQESFDPGVDRVYIASGLNFPDALSAGALAAQKGAPVLLTHPDTLLDAVRTELNRLEPAEIILVGGTPSVSNAVESALEALSFEPDVIRIAGPDRFATNRLLVSEAFESASATTVFIATGLKFPDALAAAPAAAEGGGAVILVNGGAASLDTATLQLLDSLDVVDVRIVGDPASVSSGIENQLKTLYPGHVLRFAGADRYATAAKIVAATWPGGASDVILASGVNFPDALAASALGEPMLTSLPSCIPGVILAELGNLAPSTVTLVGDAGALSTAVENNFAHC
jgi:putative cell wall-binding protein